MDELGGGLIEAPSWWTGSAPPDWVLAELGEVPIGWRNLGPRRWAGVLPNVFAPDLLLLCNAAGSGYARFALRLEDEGPDVGWITDRTFDELQQRLDREALPECVAPGCTDKGAALFHVAELGHLAGRIYNVGDPIRMCQPHAYDVFGAGEGIDSIAEWLRPDAEVLDGWKYPLAHYDGLSREQTRQKYGRLPRVAAGLPMVDAAVQQAHVELAERAAGAGWSAERFAAARIESVRDGDGLRFRLVEAVEALQDETAAELGIPVSLLRYRPRPAPGGSVQPPAEVLAAQAAFDGGNGGLSPLESWHNRQMIRRMPH